MTGKMYLAQRWINNAILLTFTVDIVFGYVLKYYGGVYTARGFGLLYLFNIVVLVGVYRFWKIPLFSWDDLGFVLYGISPFRKVYGSWERTDKAGFKTIENKNGMKSEFLVIVFLNKERVEKVGAVPMKYVGFADRLKAEFMAFTKEKKIPPL